jgi:ribosomal protein L11 methylase PrmA
MPGAHRLLRLSLAAGFEDELLAFAQEAGWGSGVAIREFPGGLLADEPECSLREVEVHLYVTAERVEDVSAALLAWQSSWPERGPELRFLSSSPLDLEQDPEQAWQSHWKPLRCSGFVLAADFIDLTTLPLRAGDCVLRLVPGSAFGTGGHPTTRMALRGLRWMWESRQPRRWLDVGTGSGILAVAAASLGADLAAGMDPEAASPAQLLRMAQVNGVTGRVTAWRGTLDSAASRWPAITANLFADLLQDSAQDLVRLLEPNGLLYTGGIVDRRQQETLDQLNRAGLRLLASSSLGRWRGAVWERREMGKD